MPDEVRLRGCSESGLLHHLPGEPGLRFGCDGTDTLRSPCCSSRANARALLLPKPCDSLFAHQKTVFYCKQILQLSLAIRKRKRVPGKQGEEGSNCFPSQRSLQGCAVSGSTSACASPSRSLSQHLCHLGWSSPVPV